MEFGPTQTGLCKFSGGFGARRERAGKKAGRSEKGSAEGEEDLCSLTPPSSMLYSGKEKAHKHEQFFPVTARVGGGGLPTGEPGIKCLCAVCGTQETKTFPSGYPAGRTGDGVTETLSMCQMCMCLFWPLSTAECTAVAGIQLPMRMRILTHPQNSLASFSHQIF